MQQIFILGTIVFMIESQALARASEHFRPEHRASACVLFTDFLLIQQLNMFNCDKRVLPPRRRGPKFSLGNRVALRPRPAQPLWLFAGKVQSFNMFNRHLYKTLSARPQRLRVRFLRPFYTRHERL